MASSLDRIFNKVGYYNLEREEEVDEDTCTESETETVPEGGQDSATSEEEDECYEPEAKKRRSGGVAPAVGAVSMVQRNPTRRPNPKVVNRNAVMARENRLRKKQHVENLEREIELLKEQRDRDQKALKRSGNRIQKLTRERDHLKAVIANKTGIMAVLRAVQQTGLPMTSSMQRYVTAVAKTPGGSSCDEGFGASPNPTLAGCDDDNKELLNDDLGLAEEELFGMLPADELLSSMGATSDQQVITTEHNYFEHSNHTSLESGSAAMAASAPAGVCVHIVPGGRVSVEFCNSCALNSRQAWLEEEQER